MAKYVRTLGLTAIIVFFITALVSCDRPAPKHTTDRFSLYTTRENGAKRLEGSSQPAITENKAFSREAPLETNRVSLRKVQTEKITGYKLPAEYFILSSKRFLNAVTAVTLPPDYYSNPTKTYPMVLVFGGAGESVKPPKNGALAWMHYYKMDEAIRSLERAKLQPGDFRGLVTPEELERFNRELQEHPYRGVIVACPYSPPLSLGRSVDPPDYEAYFIEELVPALLSQYRVSNGKLGIDGVSNGGARSIYYGFKYPQMFMAIGAVQGSFSPFMDLYEDLIKKNGEILKIKAIQLITSDRDSMRMSVQNMHELLNRYDIPHRYLRMTGPHDYVFNQGPGCIGLLVFHDNILHSEFTGKKIH